MIGVDVGMHGVVGLSPESTLINQLQKQGVIKEKKVGLNYEAIEEDDKDKPATVSYGYYDWDTSSSTTFANTSPSSWSLDIDSFTYGKDLIPNEEGATTKAVIDTNFAEIQIPDKMFHKLAHKMMEQDGSIYFHANHDEVEIISRKHTCDDLAFMMYDIELAIGDKIITLSPWAYVHPEYIGKKNPNECMLGFKASNDGNYHLGRNFLRNFKMGLDFEND